MRRKRLDPRFKREGDGTLRNDVKVVPRSRKYAENFDRIDWSTNRGEPIDPGNLDQTIQTLKNRKRLKVIQDYEYKPIQSTGETR